jgi:hypothetical protein
MGVFHSAEPSICAMYRLSGNQRCSLIWKTPIVSKSGCHLSAATLQCISVPLETLSRHEREWD